MFPHGKIGKNQLTRARRINIEKIIIIIKFSLKGSRYFAVFLIFLQRG